MPSGCAPTSTKGCDFSERIIEEERNIVSSLELRDVTCVFDDHATGLDGINFSLTRGDTTGANAHGGRTGDEEIRTLG